MRKAISGHLQNVCLSMTKEQNDEHMLEEILELMDDEEIEVKMIAIEMFLVLLAQFSDAVI